MNQMPFTTVSERRSAVVVVVVVVVDDSTLTDPSSPHGLTLCTPQRYSHRNRGSKISAKCPQHTHSDFTKHSIETKYYKMSVLYGFDTESICETGDRRRSIHWKCELGNPAAANGNGIYVCHMDGIGCRFWTLR